MSLYDHTWFLLRLLLSLNVSSSMKSQLIFTVCYMLGPGLSALPRINLTINPQDTMSTPFYRDPNEVPRRAVTAPHPRARRSLESPAQGRAAWPPQPSYKQASWVPCWDCPPTSPPLWGRRWSARRTRPQWSTRPGGPRLAGGSSGLSGSSAGAGSRSPLWCSAWVLEQKASGGFSTGRTCSNSHYR